MADFDPLNPPPKFVHGKKSDPKHPSKQSRRDSLTDQNKPSTPDKLADTDAQQQSATKPDARFLTEVVAKGHRKKSKPKEVVSNPLGQLKSPSPQRKLRKLSDTPQMEREESVSQTSTEENFSQILDESQMSTESPQIHPSQRDSESDHESVSSVVSVFDQERLTLNTGGCSTPIKNNSVQSTGLHVSQSERTQIVFPSNPGNYGNNEHETWTLTTDNHRRLLISFESFDTESCCDHLQIYDSTSGQRWTLSGSSHPAMLVSVGNTLQLTFSSDGSVTRTGFSLLASSIDRQEHGNFSCNFEEGFCGWKLSTEGDSYWTRQQGPTPTVDTGPNFDRTLGSRGGHYIYSSLGKGSEGDNAILISPLVSPGGLKLGNNWCFSFWYNMFGGDMGMLNVYRFPVWGNASEGELIFSWSGQCTTNVEWLKARVCVPNATSEFEIALEAVRGDGYRSDIAIDDIKIDAPEVFLFNSTEPFFACAGKVFLMEGVDQTFTCVSGNPNAELVWVLGDQQVPATDNNFHNRDKVTVSSTVLVSSTRDIHGVVLQCLAVDADHKVLDSSNVTLAVKVTPKASWISLIGSGGKELTPGGTVKVDSGIPYTFTCKANDTWPHVQIQWYLNGTLQETFRPNYGATEDSWTFTPTLESHRKEVKCVVRTRKLSDAHVVSAVILISASLQFNCTFEEGSCGWRQSAEDSSDWLVHHGPTPSSRTGPNFDRTLGNASGYYIYYEATPGGKGSNAILLSPPISPNSSQLANNWCFSFWYNMFGNDMGTLNVYQLPFRGSFSDGELIFTRSGEYTTGVEWLKARVCVPNATLEFEIALQAVRGEDFRSDIGIDDINTVTPGIYLFDSTENYPSSDGKAFLMEGVGHEFTCMVNDNPEAELVWILADNSIAATSQMFDNTDDSTVISNVLVSPTFDLHETMLLCKAVDIAGSLIDNINVTIVVEVTPKASRMSLIGSGGRQLTPGGTVNVNHGIPYTFTCEVRDTWPQAKIQWYLNDVLKESFIPPRESDGLVTTEHNWMLTPSADSHGLDVKCVAATASSLDAKVSVAVKLVVKSKYKEMYNYAGDCAFRDEVIIAL
ncbi:MAM and LDL-receptor class A domain-containing protein 2-like [Acanthaster planci]|uniref:MAM and LDL-receptor class A domain-containing protein 2-like n=1 Tax=Acanthaster planci TaxID=133434 RepID=A0A8B7ZW23_ACAPL|nr:MAM and LDL-receptor class A domain-containing protein 2-like [Acanthaster planci]